jgi:hypothetical protein
MISIQSIKTEARQKNKPTVVSSTDWANAINWTIEAWKCHLNGQKWAHDFEVCCPEQYYMLLDDNGKLILSNPESITFSDTLANREWITKLSHQIADMRAKGEWTEAAEWVKLLNLVSQNQSYTPNEDAYIKRKKSVKGYRLIRIKNVA